MVSDVYLRHEFPPLGKVKAARAEVRYEKNAEAEAVKELRALLPAAERLLGPANPDTLAIYATLSDSAKAEGNIPEATAFITKALQGAQKKLGPDHIDTKNYEAKLKELAK